MPRPDFRCSRTKRLPAFPVINDPAFKGSICGAYCSADDAVHAIARRESFVERAPDGHGLSGFVEHLCVPPFISDLPISVPVRVAPPRQPSTFPGTALTTIVRARVIPAMQTFILLLLVFPTDATWDGQSAMYVLDPSAAAPSSSAQHLAYHSFGAQPQGASYQPYNFDFSQLASAYATNAAQFAQQFAQQIATAPPVNPQVDQQNLAKYSQYLDILRNAYGIQLPGELTQQAQQSQPDFQLSSYPTATATSYQAGANPYASAQGVDQAAHRPVFTYATATAKPQPQPQAYQQYQVYPQHQISSLYGQQQQQQQQQQQSVYQQPAPVQQAVHSSEVYSQAGYPERQTYHPHQQQQPIPQPQPGAPAQPQYPSPYSATAASPYSQQQLVHPSYSVHPSQSQQPQHPPPHTVDYSNQQIPSGVPAYGGQQSHLQPQPPVPLAQQIPSTYQTAALPGYQQQVGQPQVAKPQVYTYRGPGQQAVHPTYSSNLPSHSAEQLGIDSSSAAELETAGSVYGGSMTNSIEDIYSPPESTTHPPTHRPRPMTTRPRPTTTRAPEPAPPSPPPSPTPPKATRPTEAPISAQSLTQQIRRLPAVLYVDSRSERSKDLETLLRDTYGLPLVAFYVDKAGRPQMAQKFLHQLTAHKSLPYLFICGTFIGSEQHIQDYHKNGQIPQLVEYVCGEERKKNKKTTF
ncbi:unnamed protein product [Heligmosomoides polygyrus]|uniref:Glutaredoxin domain-containing protein n=1 Tax=Heligmosomoides polygyrus TaxID=6339 RepID=A0A3P7XQW2_HELPZ|nr:unnamed protein product [Heligmosomoides polygyrus]